ncbi:gamma-glutamyltransferase [Nonomuraea ferruginea]
MDGHPNEVAPRRRPLHTLNAWLVTDDAGWLRHAGNTPGGDGQVQWNTQLLSHLLDHGADPARAVGAPGSPCTPAATPTPWAARTSCGARPGWGGGRWPGSPGWGTRSGRRARGGAGGSALVISIGEESGALLGAADPRQDGVALGV